MAANTETDISDALKTHLSGMSGAWPIAWPNVDFTRPSDGRYLRVSLQPNDTETTTLGQHGKWYMGLLLVSCVTKTGIGENVAMTMAETVARRFDYLTTIATAASGNVNIPARPSVRPGITGKDSYEIPVVIRYYLKEGE